MYTSEVNLSQIMRTNFIFRIESGQVTQVPYRGTKYQTKMIQESTFCEFYCYEEHDFRPVFKDKVLSFVHLSITPHVLRVQPFLIFCQWCTKRHKTELPSSSLVEMTLMQPIRWSHQKIIFFIARKHYWSKKQQSVTQQNGMDSCSCKQLLKMYHKLIFRQA